MTTFRFNVVFIARQSWFNIALNNISLCHEQILLICTWNVVLNGNWQDLQWPDAADQLFVALFCTLFHFTLALFRDVTVTQNVGCVYLV
jgi:hypothetical protein